MEGESIFGDHMEWKVKQSVDPSKLILVEISHASCFVVTQKLVYTYAGIDSGVENNER